MAASLPPYPSSHGGIPPSLSLGSGLPLEIGLAAAPLLRSSVGTMTSLPPSLSLGGARLGARGQVDPATPSLPPSFSLLSISLTLSSCQGGASSRRSSGTRSEEEQRRWHVRRRSSGDGAQELGAFTKA